MVSSVVFIAHLFKCWVILFAFLSLTHSLEQTKQFEKINVRPRFKHQFRIPAIGQNNGQWRNRFVPKVKKKPNTIYILFWVGPFGDEPEFRIDPKLCGNCVLTYDQNYLDASDAVIVHFTEANPHSLPSIRRRKKNQMFVFYSTESPYSICTMRQLRFPNMRNYFNWTMTYRRDSDIYMPFVELARKNGVFNGMTRKQFGRTAVQRILDKKHSGYTALFMTRNCGMTVGSTIRLALLNKLQLLGLRVDLYGSCFYNWAPTGALYFPFAAKYKFYMAFENAEHCRDYITEKLWTNSFEAGLVPVVWGPTKADIEAIAPKGSYIFYEDFKKPIDLVKYLNFLSTNVVEYRKYFDWRLRQPTPAEYMMVEHGPKYQRDVGMCKMCRLLWEKRRYNNVTGIVENIYDWLLNDEPPECILEQFNKF
nr:alpha-(1,3)-fucosyltransferase 6 [Ciona intestinalis]|eukprot:XP_026695436.1 alpha-(1,3)-fucosyltransferase 6 [Ciona intestinalis]